ncbi:uncharacterized protein CLUP02_01397 [Colletotrichum lupini]|uniref:Uncharacterized protein n=1 Tax=Colletotrichum lupini TaxID=145971 RepID=A0A9Q8SCM6_9PEZI|nr:uncharacterized protein CLUP02_01397 [Colletotrichum lupini]UQC74745.1 hypothetical protein CLUP02_01397 [Colletotrichum lupini]
MVIWHVYAKAKLMDRIEGLGQNQMSDAPKVPLTCDGVAAGVRLKRQIRELARAVYDGPEYTVDEMEVKYIYARPSWVEMPKAAQMLDDAQEGIATMAETNPYWARRVPLDDNDDDDYDYDNEPV